MNFQSMEYFAAVAKNRSFTRAADALHITQQTLSAHIAGIERELGCPLLIRHIPLELTYAGEVFLRYATEFNTKYDCMLHEFGDILNNQTGKLQIGIAFTRGHAIMPELIAAFQKEYPGVDVELVESSNDVLQKYLLDGTIDLAIANFSVRIPGIILRDFYEEEMVLIVSTALLQNIYGKQTEAIIQEVSRHHRYSLLAPCPFLLNREHDLVGRTGGISSRQTTSSPRFMPALTTSLPCLPSARWEKVPASARKTSHFLFSARNSWIHSMSLRSGKKRGTRSNLRGWNRAMSGI